MTIKRKRLLYTYYYYIHRVELVRILQQLQIHSQIITF